MIAVSQVTKQYGSKVLYKNGSFQINPGEKIGLVGPNGAGKTTIFKILTREENVDAGTVTIPDKLVVGYFSQNIEDIKGRSAIEEVKAGAGRVSLVGRELLEIEQKLQEPMDEDEMMRILDVYGRLQGEFEQLGGYDLDARAAEILTGLGIGPEDYHRPVESFSGGWKMRIELAKILAQKPDVLLMDEPTNHLDLESIMWLEQWLQQYPGALLMTSHDREFMNRICSKIIEVAHQNLTVYSGNYDFYYREKDLRKEQLIAAAKRQEDMLAKEEEFIARFAARASHAAQVQSRVKKIEKIERIEIPTEEESIQFQWPEPPRGGDEVVRFENLGKIWTKENGKEHLVFQNASGLVKRMDRVAVVGVNGAGKSTMLKMMTGVVDPSFGKIQVGASIVPGYFSQNSLDVLTPHLTILEELQSRLPNANLGYLRSLLGAFKFSKDEVDKKISILSGGEKSRVVLATILAQPRNLLVLDEPTNHLDIQSREVLLDAIKSFPGTVVMVSHDRFFLKELATRVFELDKNQLHVYDESFDEYLRRKAEAKS